MLNEQSAASYKERVYNHLKQIIIANEVRPGEIINERGVADVMSVSRTPVREAIQMLESEGWVSVQPWKGAVVLPVTREDVDDVFQLRMLLEPAIIEQVITRLTDENLDYLGTLMERQRRLSGQDDSGREFIRIDQDFHMYLAGLTGSRRVVQFMTQLRDIQLRLGVVAVQQSARFAETLSEHEAILQGLKNRECLQTKQAMIYHLLQTRRAQIPHPGEPLLS